MAEQSQQYSITLLCKALEVSESGSDAWKGRKASHHCREDAKLAGEIQQILSSPSPSLWESAHPCGAQSAWQALFTQASAAADAPVGLVSWSETFAQADHQKRSTSSICPQSSQSGVDGRAANEQMGQRYQSRRTSRGLVVSGCHPRSLLTYAGRLGGQPPKMAPWLNWRSAWL